MADAVKIIDQSGRQMQPLPTTKAEVPAPQNLLEVIARAASDPTVDIDKMDRLLQMQERLERNAAEAQFNEAMTAAQTEMGRIATNKDNAQTKSRYADYASLDRVVRPIYTRHGFALSFNTGKADDPDEVRIIALASRGKFTREYHIDLAADGKGAKGGDVMTKTHATVAATTYGRRALLTMIFNLAIGEDTDGNMPGASITDDQAEEIKKILEKGAESLGGDYGDWLNNLLIFAKADGLNAIHAKDFEKVLKAAKKAANVK